MLNSLTFAALAALCGFAAAAPTGSSIASALTAVNPVQSVNSTHFVDPFTNHTYTHFDCDVHSGKASDHLINTIQNLEAGTHNTIREADPAAAATAAKTIKVNAYFHIITTVAKANTITQAMANAQVAAMNAAYLPQGVQFNLVKTTFTANDAWAVAAGSDMAALKQALRQGTYADLNLYFHTDLTGGILGTCTLPNALPAGAAASAYVADGCNVNAGTLPAGDIYGYNLGMTAVHETGHWLGLLHTFEGYACTGTGDYISDTPMQSVATSGCPNKPAKDSCPTVTGVDPIHNYMDYSTDACYTNFTPGQTARIQSLWTEYRKGH